MIAHRRETCSRLSVGVIAMLLTAAARSPARADLAFEPTWQPTTYEAARGQIRAWLEDAKLDPRAVAVIRDQWPVVEQADVAAGSLLDRVVDSFAVALPQAAELKRRCQGPYAGPSPPSTEWLVEPNVPPVVRNNLRLYHARWLAQYGLYDEVLNVLGDLKPVDVIDPAALLFYRMAAHHQLVEPDAARMALVQLMEHEDKLPRRFQQVAQLVDRDLSALEDESLDHIARRMRDIRRRLDYGRAGSKVQEIEDGVVKSLDKKIDDLEKQQQQQQCACAAGSAQSSKPMDDSRLAELKAPMQVDRRDIGHQSGWGDLPPKEREQALQQVGREFPAHYRELIEQYFRELANEPAPPEP